MDKTRQAIQQFFTDLWQRFNADWLPALTSYFLLILQWLQDNAVATLLLSAAILLLGCLTVRKGIREGWSFARLFWTIVLFLLGFAGILVVVHSI
jgi:hypothetical protein